MIHKDTCRKRMDGDGFPCTCQVKEMTLLEQAEHIFWNEEDDDNVIKLMAKGLAWEKLNKIHLSHMNKQGLLHMDEGYQALRNFGIDMKSLEAEAKGEK